MSQIDLPTGIATMLTVPAVHVMLFDNISRTAVKVSRVV